MQLLRSARRTFRQWFPRRPTAIGKSAGSANPFGQETIDRWFSAETCMDSQLEKIAAELQPNRTDSPTFERVSLQLFGVPNIYANYRLPPTQQEGAYATHIQAATLERLLSLLGSPPRLGLEVGSYVGHGACVLGALVKEHNGLLVCIDTWCGDVNHHFMRRIIGAGLQDTVIPLRVSSVVAARMLKVLGYKVDFVYLDSAHEAGETFLEMNLYYDLLRPGGALLGDDFSWFPAVKYDVLKFMEFKHLQGQLMEDRQTWLIQKPL
jgi:predicted O-methyltransferase YrrM